MEEQVGDRILVKLQEAIDFVNEIQVRFEDRSQYYDLFLDVTRRFNRGRNLVHNTVASVLHAHPDLLRIFEGFLSDSKPLPLSQTVLAKHQDAVEALELQAHAFLILVSRRLHHVDFVVFMEEIHQCRVKEFDRDQSKAVVEKYIGQFPDLMKEFENFWNKSAKVKTKHSKKKRKHKQSTSANQPCLYKTQDCTCPQPSKISKLDASLLDDHGRPKEELQNK